MRYCNLCWFLPFLIIGCSSSRQENEELNELLSELEEIDFSEESEDLEAEEPSVYHVEVIYDDEEVSNLQARIDYLVDTRRFENTEEQRVGQRYIRGDVQLKDEVVALLKGEHSDDKSDLFWDLQGYYRPEFELKDPQIIRAVTANLYKWRDEEEAISLMAAQNLPNRLNLFEQHLLSGNAAYTGELIYQLGQEARSLKALNYLDDELHADGMNYSQLSSALSGLWAFRTKGDKAIQDKADQICMYIYRSSIIDQDEFDELEEDYAYGNPARKLLEYLLNFGGEEVRGIALKYQDNESLEEEAFNCLVRLDGDKYRREIINRMKYSDTYISGVESAGILYEKTGDARILQSAITNFEYLNTREDYLAWDLENLVHMLVDALGEGAAGMLETHLKDEVILEHALDVIEIKKMTVEDIAVYLHELELVDKPIAQKAIEKASIDRLEWAGELYVALDASDIHLWFNHEETNILEEYEYLIEVLQSSCQNKLEGLNFAIDQVDGNEVEYLALFNGVGYMLTLEGRSEWDYRIMADVIHLVNFVLTENNCEKQFYSFNYDEYVFGTEEQLNKLRDKFRIADEEYYL